MLKNSNCLLCQSTNTKLYYTKNVRSAQARHYYRCETCALIFVDPSHHLTLNEQKSFYNHHQNNPQDPGYRQHLNTLAQPLLKHLKPKSKGLDFGCGPGPTLHLLISEHQHQMLNYDPIYCPNTHILDEQYDFVTSTEVVEHFTKPLADWQHLTSLVKPNGVLGIMTQFQPQEIEFANWWYHRDVTHVCFYNTKTFEWIAQKFSFKILFCENPVVIFERVSHSKVE